MRQYNYHPQQSLLFSVHVLLTMYIYSTVSKSLPNVQNKASFQSISGCPISRSRYNSNSHFTITVFNLSQTLICICNKCNGRRIITFLLRLCVSAVKDELLGPSKESNSPRVDNQEGLNRIIVYQILHMLYFRWWLLFVC